MAGSSVPRPSPRRAPVATGSGTWPTAPRGWVAVAAAVVGLGSWLVLPLVTTIFADVFPITDTVVMPVIGLTLTAVAAVVNVAVLWWGRQRSAVNIVLTVLTVGATLFFGFFVIGEGLGGA